MTDNAIHRKRVLVVDDDQAHVATLRRLLTANGFEVRTANDGPTALSTLRDFLPDFAVVDIGLPVMHGYELARLLREQSPNTMLIAMTGWTREQDRAAALRAGFDVHLGKPVRFEKLKAILSQ